MKEKKYLLNFNLLYLTSYFGLGVFLPYLNLWLEQVHHFNGIQIGIINALSMLIGISIAPIFGYFSDKTQENKKILLWIFILMLITLQIYAHSYTYIFVLIIACIFEIFKASAYPLSDVIASQYTTKINISFGFIRMFGSLGYMLGSIFTGMFLDSIGFNGTLFTTFSVAIFIAIIALFFTPVEKTYSKHKIKINFIQILKNPNFYTIFIYIIFTTTLIDASSAFISNHLVTNLKANEALVSYFTLVMVFPEMCFLPFSQKFIYRFGYKKFYILSAILVSIRLMITGLTQNPYIVVLMPITHFTSIIISTVGNISFFRTKFKEHQIASVITLLTAGVGIVRSIYNLLFGYIYTNYSSHIIFILSSILVCIAILFVATTKIFKSMD